MQVFFWKQNLVVKTQHKLKARRVNATQACTLESVEGNMIPDTKTRRYGKKGYCFSKATKAAGSLFAFIRIAMKKIVKSLSHILGYPFDLLKLFQRSRTNTVHASQRAK